MTPCHAYLGTCDSTESCEDNSIPSFCRKKGFLPKMCDYPCARTLHSCNAYPYQEAYWLISSARWQAIAALNRAMATDPNNAEVLLSLGVSYTNELDQGRALNFLTAWLSRQPVFTKVLLMALQLCPLLCAWPGANCACCALSMLGAAHSTAPPAL